MNNEKRINEIMNSLDGIRRAEVSPYLYTRILNRIDQPLEQTSAKFVWLAAASLALLFALNFSAIRHAAKKTENKRIESLATGYNLMNENSFNYN